MFAQSPQMPNICLVTVNNDSLVELKWTHSDTSAINGFIIKRKIFNGVGVVDGTINNIQILENTYLKYSDTSVSYSTFANPYIRSEEYAMNAYLIRNDSTIFSNMTFSQKTIFLNVAWDECAQKANFSWNKYLNRSVLKYQLFYSLDNFSYSLLNEFSPDDTSFFSSSFLKNTHYYIKLKAILESQGSCSADTSVSNIAHFFTFCATAPTDLISISANVLDNNCINLNFYKNGGNGIKKIIILKNSDEQIAEFAGNEINVEFCDFTNTQVPNCYKVQSLDTCGKILKESADVCNIVLNVIQDYNKYILNFSTTTLRELQADFYSIFVDIGNNWQEIGQTTKNEFLIKLSDIFQNQNNIQLQNVGFRIMATKGADEAFSNSVYLPLEPIIAVPNAINPFANNEKDRFFTIKSMFINDFEIVIFTENNELVFKSVDINNSWNGYLKNSTLAPRGAYIYSLKYMGNNNKWHKKSGVVNLVY